MKQLVILWCLFFLSIQDGITQITISGWIKDNQTKEVLPFATVGIQGSSLGTLSNGTGFFELKIPDTQASRPVVISFLGYETIQLAPETFAQDMTVFMKVKVIQLADLIVRPLTPEEYIKRASKKINTTLGEQPYGALSYYREKFQENGEYLGFTEGVFKSYHPTFNDTLPNQYQILLYQTAENPGELQFMRETMEKKSAKKQKKAEKKGEVYDDQDGFIEANFGGPEDILSMDLRKKPDPFLDSTQFKKFTYSFGNPVQYQDRELLTINFKSKGTVEHLRSKGKIYIDIKSDAFVSIEYEGDLVIPIAIQPILFTIGIYIQEPYVKKTLRYQLVDGHWYPEYFAINLDIGLEKRHLFDANEKSRFKIEQLLKANEIIPSASEIPEEKRFNPRENAAEQLQNDLNIEWADVSTIRDESIQGES